MRWGPPVHRKGRRPQGRQEGWFARMPEQLREPPCANICLSFMIYYLSLILFHLNGLRECPHSCARHLVYYLWFIIYHLNGPREWQHSCASHLVQIKTKPFPYSTVESSSTSYTSYIIPSWNTSAGEAFCGQDCPGVTMFGFSRVPWVKTCHGLLLTGRLWFSPSEYAFIVCTNNSSLEVISGSSW